MIFILSWFRKDKLKTDVILSLINHYFVVVFHDDCQCYIHAIHALKLARQALYQKHSRWWLARRPKAKAKDRNIKDCWVRNAAKVIRLYFGKTRPRRSYHVFSHIQRTKNLENERTVKIKTKSLEIYFSLRASNIEVSWKEVVDLYPVLFNPLSATS